MGYWLFQSRPDKFRINEYLTENDYVYWQVRRESYIDKISLGDTVFILRAQGNDKNNVAGIVARAYVSQLPQYVKEAYEYRKKYSVTLPSKGPLKYKAVGLSLDIVRVNNPIKRDWLGSEKLFENRMHIQHSNFDLSEEQGKRLDDLIQTTGTDWSQEQAMAALWAYNKTYNIRVSKSDNSPVGLVGRLIGRPYSGVYNKLMNFRSLDLRNEKKGLSAVSDIDKIVWGSYFDQKNNTLNVALLEQDFSRVWLSDVGDHGNDLEGKIHNKLTQAKNDDGRKASSERAVRSGQQKFKDNLIDLYDGVCAITGWGPVAVLEAAHVVLHSKSGLNHTDNGILLRRDIHKLFDDNLVKINPADYSVSVDKKLRKTEYYKLNGVKLRPRNDGSQPDKSLLEARYRAGS